MSTDYSVTSSSEERSKAKSYLDCLADKTISDDVVIQRYHKSSDIYDDNMVILNYNAPRETASAVAELFPSNKENVFILDIAAGTGLCAVELRKAGFSKMDAVDASTPMLNEARKKDLYGRYVTHMLGELPMDIKDNTYDVVTICGMSTMVMTKLPVKAFEDIIRVVRPGGYVINTVFYTTLADDNAETAEFRGNMKQLESDRKWKLTQVKKIAGFINGRDGGISIHQVC